MYSPKKCVITFKVSCSCLQMKEIDVDNVDVPLEEPELVCDVVCLMFDQSQKSSFEKIAKIYVVRTRP